MKNTRTHYWLNKDKNLIIASKRGDAEWVGLPAKFVKSSWRKYIGEGACIRVSIGLTKKGKEYYSAEGVK